MKRALLCFLSMFVIAAPRVHADSTLLNGDVFEMRLSGPPEEFTREFNLVLTVDEGAVTVPLVGRVAAVGMTSSQLASSIEQRLKFARIFTIANVNITQTKTERTIIVGGSVRQSGKQPWIADLTLSGAISSAGGPSDFAGDGVKIIRAGRAVRYSRKAIRKDPSVDPKVLAGDIIEVEGD